MHVEYSRKEEDEEGRFSGAATIVVKTDKAAGSIALSFDEEGHVGARARSATRSPRTCGPTSASS